MWRPRYRAIFAVAALFGVVCAAIVLASPENVHWSPDCSVKYLAVRSLRYENGIRYDVPYVGRSIDPGMRAVPMGETYYDIRNSEIHVSWPELFPILVCPFYHLFGWYGLFILPLACGILCIYLTGRIAELIRPRTGWIAALLAAVTTPIAIYSTLLWEHTPALALMLSALYLSLQFQMGGNLSKVALGAACIGLAAAGLRTDANLFFAAWVAALFVMTTGKRRWYVPPTAAIGFVVGASPASALNWITNGKILAANTMKNAPKPSLDYLKQAGLGIFPHFFAGKGVPLLDAWLVILATVCAVMAYYFLRGSLRTALLVLCAGVATAGSVMALVDALHTNADEIHGFLIMAPCLVLGLFVSPANSQFERRSAIRFLIILSISFCLLNLGALAAAYPNGWAADGNREWGPRYWLAIFPLLSILAAVNYDAAVKHARKYERMLLLAGGAAVTLASFAFEIGGLVVVEKFDAFQNRVRMDIVRQGETPLFTDMFFVSALAPEQYLTRPSFYILHHQDATFDAWFPSAAQRGLTRFDYAMFGDLSTNSYVGRNVGGWRLIVDGIDRDGELRMVHLHAVRVAAAP